MDIYDDECIQAGAKRERRADFLRHEQVCATPARQFWQGGACGSEEMSFGTTRGVPLWNQREAVRFMVKYGMTPMLGDSGATFRMRRDLLDMRTRSGRLRCKERT